MYGAVRLEDGTVLFTHDRHQEAARALIPPNQRSEFLANIARKLEKQGQDYVFVVADLLTDALPTSLHEWSNDVICETCRFSRMTPSYNSILILFLSLNSNECGSKSHSKRGL